MNTNDVFVWKDGFWCFREEYSQDFGRSDNYRVLLQQTEKWLAHTHEPASLSSIELSDAARNLNKKSPPAAAASSISA